MTNEEKIKSLNREELAEFLAVVDVNQPEYCKNAGNQFCSGQLCVDCAMKWLGEEAKQ